MKQDLKYVAEKNIKNSLCISFFWFTMTSKVIYCPILHLTVTLTTPSIECKTSIKVKSQELKKNLLPIRQLTNRENINCHTYFFFTGYF